MAGFQIDGVDVTEVNIDGQEVTEVQLDGVQVWTAVAPTISRLDTPVVTTSVSYTYTVPSGSNRMVFLAQSRDSGTFQGIDPTWNGVPMNQFTPFTFNGIGSSGGKAVMNWVDEAFMATNGSGTVNIVVPNVSSANGASTLWTVSGVEQGEPFSEKVNTQESSYTFIDTTTDYYYINFASGLNQLADNSTELTATGSPNNPNTIMTRTENSISNGNWRVGNLFVDSTSSSGPDDTFIVQTNNSITITQNSSGTPDTSGRILVKKFT